MSKANHLLATALRRLQLVNEILELSEPSAVDADVLKGKELGELEAMKQRRLNRTNHEES